MKIKESVLGSKSEADIFLSLETRWAPNYKIFPSIPLSCILKPEPDELNREELNYFYKTHVDYTFCQSNNRPIFSIEFDGMGGGFSRDGVYITKRKTNDPNRKKKIDFKLKCATKVDYPIVVVSFEEGELLDKDDSFTILDAIIGQILARREFIKIAEKMMEAYQTELEELDEREKKERIQDILLFSEVDAEMAMDPIAKKAAEYEQHCHEIGFIKHYGFEALNDPPLPEYKDIFDIKGLEARIAAMKKTMREGCRIIIETRKLTITKVVWVRNFEAWGVYPHSIARNIAEYLGFKKAYSLLPKM